MGMMGFASLYPSYKDVRHCEERSDEAIHSFFTRRNGLLRFARNDDLSYFPSHFGARFSENALGPSI